MTLKLSDLVNAKRIAAYYNTATAGQPPLLGETLFPARKKLGLDLSYIKGSKGVPVSLAIGSFDAKAPLRDRIGVQKVDTEMPFFREGMAIKEKERQELLRLQEADPELYNSLLSFIYDDANNLVMGARVVNERMRMQLLSTGKIDIADGTGKKYTYDFKMKAANKKTLTGTSKWSDTTNSDPIGDLTTAMDAIESNSGVRPTRAVMTRKTWSYLLKNASIKNDFNIENGSKIILTDGMLKNYLSTKIGLEVAIYTKKYALKLDGTTYSYFPDEVVSLVPAANLGNTWFGTTPEEADHMALAKTANFSLVNTGIAVTTVGQVDPVNVKTIVSEIALPSFETIDSCYILTVHS